MILGSDRTSMIIAKNLVHHERKNTWELIAISSEKKIRRKTVKPTYVGADDQIAYFLTNAVTGRQLSAILSKLHTVNIYVSA